MATIHSEPAPSGTGSAVVELVDLVVAVGAGAVVVVGALVAVGGLVRGLIVEAGAGVVGAVVVAGAVLVGGAVVGAGAVVVGAEVALAVGAAVGVGVVPLLATLNFPRRLDLVPSDHVSPTGCGAIHRPASRCRTAVPCRCEQYHEVRGAGSLRFEQVAAYATSGPGRNRPCRIWISSVRRRRSSPFSVEPSSRTAANRSGFRLTASLD